MVPIQQAGPDKSIAQLPGISPNLAGQMIFYLTCPEKCIEYIGNIVIPSHFQDAVESGQVAETWICQALQQG